jgi:1-acyl-sn-glycerol-3-phosphate acyltransferase
LKPVLFLDTYNRMNYRSIFSLNPGRCRAVYLDEIPVDELSLTDASILKEKVYTIMDKKLREYHAAWIKNEPVK